MDPHIIEVMTTGMCLLGTSILIAAALIFAVYYITQLIDSSRDSVKPIIKRCVLLGVGILAFLALSFIVGAIATR